MLLDKLKALECSLHGEKRHDRNWLEQRLHPDFCEITRSGISVNRAETLASLVQERVAPIIISDDFQLITTTECSAILHYRTFESNGAKASLRASCWVRSSEDVWTLIFHQGTPAAGSA
ncbi:DUF4440 domain-containing protein [Pantoea sp. MMK3]|uniref:DUF4440 domain-containing protein n=1 Tax=Pantoea trifolii TaxID=2968030 RepID=A0ABT1VS32_9GAMM|nr:DUF4440 domain-containing protein [Pantoea sp. MMK2]MCQ8239205.1 DUF4440 domain-containing protein [Pantoea sp. MMK3]